MTLELRPLLSDDDLDFISSVLESTISDCSAALRVRERYHPGQYEPYLERIRERAFELRQRLEQR